MSILDRYIVRRFGFTLLFAVVSFVFIFIFVDMVGNLAKFIDKEVPNLIILKFYGLYVPYIVTLVLPIAVLLACMFSLGQMARYNELVAIRSNGIALTRILRPLFAVGFLTSVMALYFGEGIAPIANQQKSAIEIEYLDPFARRTGTSVQNVYYQDGLDRRIFIGRYDGKRKIAHRVTIQSYHANTITERLDARSMEWQDSLWVLNKGFRRSFDNGGEMATSFEKLVEKGLDFTPDQLLENQAKPEDMSYQQLRGFVKEVARNGGDPRKWQVDLQFKLSTPFASFILLLCGAPLASNKNRSGAILGLVMSLGIYLLYFGTTRLLKTLGEVGTVEPVVAGWTTNGVFLAAGMFLLILNVRR